MITEISVRRQKGTIDSKTTAAITTSTTTAKTLADTDKWIEFRAKKKVSNNRSQLDFLNPKHCDESKFI